MAVVQPFLNPGQCSMPDCEVTLKFDENESYLYVCKHPLANLSHYFKTMFLGEFKEKNKNEIEIHEVSQSDMLLFLQFAVPVEKFEAVKPSTIGQLYILIKLADVFSCTKLLQEITDNLPKLTPDWYPNETDGLCELISLGDRLLTCDLNQAIVKHILGTKSMYENASKTTKLPMVEAAYKHQESSTLILETCIRLCANLDLDEVAQLRGKGLDGVVFAIYDAIDEATPKCYRHGPLTREDPKHDRKKCGENRFNGLSVTRGCGSLKRWYWHCSTCGGSSRDEATMPLEKVMQIKIKSSLLQ